MRIYKKTTAHFLYTLMMLCTFCFAKSQPPRGPLVISPQVLPDKKITFRYLAPSAKEVKLGGSQFGANQVPKINTSKKNKFMKLQSIVLLSGILVRMSPLLKLKSKKASSLPQHFVLMNILSVNYLAK